EEGAVKASMTITFHKSSFLHGSGALLSGQKFVAVQQTPLSQTLFAGHCADAMHDGGTANG
ncbi:MAG: hypothetical protein KC496_22775, partial [Anaerolineae bacterium]|nr:hypothetical protein [Anaerolineae bacterium]